MLKWIEWHTTLSIWTIVAPPNMSKKLQYYEPYIHHGTWLFEYKFCFTIWQNIHHWIDNWTINIYHLDATLTFEPYLIQIRHNTCRIRDNIVTSQTSTRQNNNPSWECHVSLNSPKH